MVFSSSVFLFLFLPLNLLVYYLLKDSYRNLFLLLASFAFYAWAGPKYLIVLLISILINYLFGLILSGMKSSGKWERRIMLFVGIAANLSMLFYFKYYNFFFRTVNRIVNTSFALKNIALPLGVSFFTFCGISYLSDVYKGKTEVQKNPLNVALYLSFFPKLAQGPIARYGDMAGQIEKRTCTVEKFSEGIWRFTIGLSKKMIIADQLGIMVDSIYKNPADSMTASVAWLGAVGYTFQIYFDFSGYSDMAVGLGKMFGFDIMENFNYPYVSTSISDFWRRWHISLSSWFRDYLYIPLGGNRTGNVYINLLIVFIATGLWHGAAWNFVAWGLFHGFFMLLERVLRNRHIEIPLPNTVKILLTFFVVNLGWVLFRAPNLTYALKFIQSMFGLTNSAYSGFSASAYLHEYLILFVIVILASLPISKWIVQKSTNISSKIDFAKIPVCIILFLVSISYIINGSYNPFLYMNF